MALRSSVYSIRNGLVSSKYFAMYAAESGGIATVGHSKANCTHSFHILIHKSINSKQKCQSITKIIILFVMAVLLV